MWGRYLAHLIYRMWQDVISSYLILTIFIFTIFSLVIKGYQTWCVENPAFCRWFPSHLYPARNQTWLGKSPRSGWFFHQKLQLNHVEPFEVIFHPRVEDFFWPMVTPKAGWPKVPRMRAPRCTTRSTLAKGKAQEQLLPRQVMVKIWKSKGILQGDPRGM